MPTCYKGRTQRLTVDACRNGGGRFAPHKGKGRKAPSKKRRYGKLGKKGACKPGTLGRYGRVCGCKTLGGGFKAVPKFRCKGKGRKS